MPLSEDKHTEALKYLGNVVKIVRSHNIVTHLSKSTVICLKVNEIWQLWPSYCIY